MGSSATLDVGTLCVDYSKNFLNDHTCLFVPSDRTTAGYDYVTDEGAPIVEEKDAYVAPLGDVLPRLEMMGITVERLRREHEGSWPNFPFEALAKAFRLCAIDAGSPSRSVWGDLDGAFAREFESLLEAAIGQDALAPFRDELSIVLEELDPLVVLRLLAENPSNANVPVVWQFADVVEGGWAEPNAVHATLPIRLQFLIVTEGSTDAHILKKAFAMRRRRIADFFYFVDMTENYPFSGTGSLFNFSKGLGRIRIQNQVIVLYDNDTEGQTKLKATHDLGLPPNIRALALPSLKELEAFPTLGPGGRLATSINETAAAIECYLDLGWAGKGEPMVRWTNYVAAADRYQGSLIGKDEHTKAFLALRDHEQDQYDFSKLDLVLDTLISTAVAMAEAVSLDNL